MWVTPEVSLVRFERFRHYAGPALSPGRVPSGSCLASPGFLRTSLLAGAKGPLKRQDPPPPTYPLSYLSLLLSSLSTFFSPPPSRSPAAILTKP